MINTIDPSHIKILYRAEMHENLKWGVCFSWTMQTYSCSPLPYLCKGAKAVDNYYIQVHENRIESNYPMYAVLTGMERVDLKVV